MNKPITLYRYKRADGGTTVSPNKPSGECEEFQRLYASKGKLLTNDGVTFKKWANIESIDGWYEVDDPDYNEREARYAIPTVQ